MSYVKQPKLLSYMRYKRVKDILFEDNALKHKLSSDMVAVGKADRRSFEDMPKEVCAVTEEIAKRGYDSMTMKKIEVIRFAHQLLIGTKLDSPVLLPKKKPLPKKSSTMSTRNTEDILKDRLKQLAQQITDTKARLSELVKEHAKTEIALEAMATADAPPPLPAKVKVRHNTPVPPLPPPPVPDAKVGNFLTGRPLAPPLEKPVGRAQVKLFNAFVKAVVAEFKPEECLKGVPLDAFRLEFNRYYGLAASRSACHHRLLALAKKGDIHYVRGRVCTIATVPLEGGQ